MIGAIIGDIAGSVYEFNNIRTKDFALLTDDCFATDDTIMTIAIANICARSGRDTLTAVTAVGSACGCSLKIQNRTTALATGRL